MDPPVGSHLISKIKGGSMNRLIPWSKSKHGHQVIQWSYRESPVGYCLIAWVNEGVCSLSLHPLKAHKKVALKDLKNRFPEMQFMENMNIPFWADIVKNLEGQVSEGSLSLILKGTEFQLRVWKALSRFPASKTTTYKELAELVGSPNAFRAVGSAVGLNPIGVLIPCHRVLRSDRGIGGFRWGLDAKRKLLQREGIAGY